MRKKNFIWCCIAVALLLSSGCKLQQYEKSLVGTWKVDSWYKNGEDQTTEFLVAFYHYRITFHSDGYFTEEYQTSILLPITITITGTWEVTGKPGAFQLQLTDESQVRIFNIKKLTKNTVDIYRDLGGSDNEEFFLEPVPE
jgi:hypothetical protein